MAKLNPARIFKKMVDIELTGMRTRDQEHPQFDTSQVGLLSSDHEGVANSNGHIHPENEAFLRTSLEKPPSVSVKAKKARRKWWILALILFLVLVVSVICIALFFGVSDNAAKKPAIWLNSTVINSSLVTPQTTQAPNPVPKLHIQSFQAFPEFSDSKILEVTFSNGTTIRTFGHKGVDGSFHSLYSISVGDAQGSDLTHIYFRGQNNFASVMLPQGTIVTYDWTSGFKSLECKLFSVPKPGADINTPLSHVVTLPLGEHSDIFVRITNGLIKPHVQFRTNVSRAECNSRLPLRVTKCGQQYTYPGAFIQGGLTSESGPSLSMDALPWPTTQDNCYNGEKEMPNYFLPLPLQTNVSREERKRRFASSGTSVFVNLCLSIEGSDSNLDSDICKEVASGLGEDNLEVLYDHIYGSCFKIFHSIRLICISLKVSNSRDVTGEQFQLSRPEIYQSLYQHAASVDKILGPRIYVTVTAYCPSVHPVSSYRQLIDQSNPITLKDMIHINCPNSPEVTRFVIGHKFIGPSSSSSSLDRIDHLLAICASCASGTVMHVQVSRDETCCTNTCTRSDVCEIGPHIPFSDNTKFDEQKDVYCYQFLKQYQNSMQVVNQSCVQGCQMRFSVHFKLYKSDPGDQQTYYSQKLTCNKDDAFSCKRTFGR